MTGMTAPPGSSQYLHSHRQRSRQLRPGSRKQQGARRPATRIAPCTPSPAQAVTAHLHQTALPRRGSMSRQQLPQGDQEWQQAQSLSNTHPGLSRSRRGPLQKGKLLLRRHPRSPTPCSRAPQRMCRALAAAAALHRTLGRAGHAYPCPICPTGGPQMPAQPQSGSANPHCRAARAAQPTSGPLRCIPCYPNLFLSLKSRCESFYNLLSCACWALQVQR